MNGTIHTMLRAAAIVGVVALAGIGSIALVHSATAARIEVNERTVGLRTLRELMPAGEFENGVTVDAISITGSALGTRHPQLVYLARKAARPFGAGFSAPTPDGCGGTIGPLVAVRTDGTVATVRVTHRNETPGLGGSIEAHESDWIIHFVGFSLNYLPEPRWKVRKDGGEFDQFSGATTSPRAVIRAAHRTLRNVRDHHTELCAATAGYLGRTPL